MNRRKFLAVAAGTGAMLATNSLHTPSVDAFIPLLLRLGLGIARSLASNYLLEGMFGAGSRVLSRKNQAWYDSRLDAQLAQEKYFQRRFAKEASEIAVANISLSPNSHFFVAERQDLLGANPAFCFSQTHNGRVNTSAFSGPACVGIAYAARHLQEKERMSPKEIQNILMPRQKDYDDWGSWNDQTTRYTNYTTISSRNGVLIEYRAVAPQPGGYGIITVSIDAYRQINIPLKVQFT